MIALLATLAALAAQPGPFEASLDPGRLAELQQEICDVAERCRGQWPVPEVMSLQDARAVGREEPAIAVRRYQGRELTAEEEAWTREVMDQRLHGGVLGNYFRQSDRIALIADATQQLAEARLLDASSTRALHECVVIHELAHALQGPHVELSRTRSRMTTQLILLEAHATLVTREVCGRHHPGVDVHALMDVITDTELAGSGGAAAGMRAHFGYGPGARWLSDQLDVHGEAYAWTLLNDPPLTTLELEAYAREQLPAAWRAPGLAAFVHDEVDRRQPDPLWQRRSGVTTLSDALWAVEAPPGLDRSAWAEALGPRHPTVLPIPVAGFAEVGVIPEQRLYTAATYWFEDPEHARAAMAARRRRVDEQRGEAAAAGVPFTVERPRRSLRRASDEVIALTYGRDGTFVEVWARRDRALVAFFLIDVWAPNRDVQAWAARVLDRGASAGDR